MGTKFSDLNLGLPKWSKKETTHKMIKHINKILAVLALPALMSLTGCGSTYYATQNAVKGDDVYTSNAKATEVAYRPPHSYHDEDEYSYAENDWIDYGYNPYYRHRYNNPYGLDFNYYSPLGYYNPYSYGYRWGVGIYDPWMYDGMWGYSPWGVGYPYYGYNMYGYGMYGYGGFGLGYSSWWPYYGYGGYGSGWWNNARTNNPRPSYTNRGYSGGSYGNGRNVGAAGTRNAGRQQGIYANPRANRVDDGRQPQQRADRPERVMREPSYSQPRSGGFDGGRSSSSGSSMPASRSGRR